MMTNAAKLKDGIYWVGALDWDIRNFHGYTTNRGSTYNAYLIIDEKITLVDTVKKPFAQELIDRISEIIDPSKIDYLVSNHVEMDHSSSIPEIMKLAPNATIVTSAPNGLKGLKAHYGDGYNYQPVKGGDVLKIGKRSLHFVQTPMLHWPDNMVTYCPEEKILFSNDAMGQHYTSTGRFDDEVDMDEVFQEAKKYYANILMVYGTQVQNILPTIKSLDMDLVAPSHGIIWRKHISDIVGLYDKWSGGAGNDNALIIYDTMYHSTETIARNITETFIRAGKNAKLYNLQATNMSDIITEVLTAKYIAVGSSTLNNNMLATVAAFLRYLKGLTTKDKIGMAFGSYGWSGQAAGQVEEILKDCGYETPFGLYKFQYIPQKEDLDKMSADILEKLKTLP